MRPITFIAVIFIIATLIACDEGTIGPYVNNTPADVLGLLEDSFNHQSILILDGVLSTEFVFYFDPDDIGNQVGDYVIPASWSRDDHMRACGNMFELAYSINFDIVTTGIEDPEEGATTFEANNVQIHIIVMTDATNGFSAKGVCDFELIYDDSAGCDDWEVSKWYDRTSAGGSAGLLSVREPSSLGSILARYY